MKQVLTLILVVAAVTLSGCGRIRHLTIGGTKFLKNEEVKALLPLDRSWLWWRLNKEVIARKLLSRSEVEQAYVSACSFWEFSCARIDIVERKPAYISIDGTEAWFVSSEGAFISPYTEDSQLLLGTGVQLLVLKGLIGHSSSPDVIKERLTRLTKFIQRVAKKTALITREVALLPSGQLEVKCIGFDALVRFSPLDTETERSLTEMERLQSTLDRLKTKLSEVDSIDVTFERVAVVRRKAEPKEPQKSTSSKK